MYVFCLGKTGENVECTKLEVYYFKYLSILLTTFSVATSTAIKCVFSQGCQLLLFTHNCLFASLIHVFLCLGSWGHNDLIMFEDVVSAVKANSKRKREEFDLDIEVDV